MLCYTFVLVTNKVILNLACWTERKDVHGFDGTPQNLTTLAECKEACVGDIACVAFDWEPSNSRRNYCWTLTSTYVADATETGLITNYELNRACVGESYVLIKLKLN